MSDRTGRRRGMDVLVSCGLGKGGGGQLAAQGGEGVLFGRQEGVISSLLCWRKLITCLKWENIILFLVSSMF